MKAVSGSQVDNPRLGIMLIVVSSVSFALMNAVVKLISGRLGPIEIGFFRQVFSLFPVLSVVVHQGGLPVLRTRRPFGHLFRGMIGNSAMIIFFLSVAKLPLADANALSFASPLFVTALSMPLLGEAVGRHRWSAVGVGFVGVLIMTNPSGNWFGGGSGIGAGMGVLAAFMSALMTITIRQLNKTEAPVTIVFYFATIGTLFFGAMLAFFWVAPNFWEWVGLIAVGMIGGLSQLLMTYAYRHAPASTLAPFGYVSILWSTLLGFLIWNQLPDARVLAGSVIVILSGLYIIYRETRKRAQVIAQPLSNAN
ncbi:MAG: EamA/RhaT family transporter [Rhodospirillales bacterium]|nr:EamA/RhaT family transporter [Rhodospirillales bacterium]